MITTIKLLNIFMTLHSHLFCVKNTQDLLFLANFKYTMQHKLQSPYCIRFPELTYYS